MSFVCSCVDEPGRLDLDVGLLETLRDTASKHIRWSACLELSSPKLDGARKAGGIWKFLWSACLGGLNQSIKKALVFIVFLASGSSTGARGERPVIKNSWFLLYFRDFEFRGIEKHGKTGTKGSYLSKFSRF